jgi:hypothetical protein
MTLENYQKHLAESKAKQQESKKLAIKVVGITLLVVALYFGAKKLKLSK